MAQTSSHLIVVLATISALGIQALAKSTSYTGFSSATTGSTVSASSPDGISIKYKTPLPGTCETAFEDQKQYTGYVSLPPSTLGLIKQNCSINTFFWLVESRINPEKAPLTVYLNGGPGSTSLVGLFQETGPCEVIEIAKDRLGTRAREWGWDRGSNMLYIDQPVQSGFSFDSLREGSLNLIDSSYTFPPSDPPQGQPRDTWLKVVTSSNDVQVTTNTTSTAAKAMWHVLQSILTEFPQYYIGTQKLTRRRKPQSASINLFAESYGGKYAPSFVTHFEEQNRRRRRGEISASETLEINVRSIGIMQGCIDDLVQNPYYPAFAYNNSYGINATSSEDKNAFLENFSRAGGCRDKTIACREEIQTSDPENTGGVGVVNQKCLDALSSCLAETPNLYTKIGRSGHDITQSNLDPFPPHTYLEYLNSDQVQKSIGVSMNITDYSSIISSAFLNTADFDRGDYISDLAKLLDSGIRIALIYGDRDYLCNWMGGQAASFSIAASSSSPSSYLSGFNAAGYAPLITNDTYIGGMVRQFGNLSFTRIYDAGHLIPAYQPETLFTIFSRIIQGHTDISTGQPVDITSFGTKGDANSTATNSAPPMAKPTCYVRKVKDTCSPEQIAKLARGEGAVVNGVWYESESDWKKPPATKKGWQQDASKTVRDGTVAHAFIAITTPSMVGQRSVNSSHDKKSDAARIVPRWWLYGILIGVSVIILRA
ncbi:carboxypeptidase S1 [Arthroderma uncinatum]|uniref:carboxypeptidase S1 n=1 Tax=Arthroderma uncinatum TaxID=74035 RepID=UPI00144A85B2|nr:carboxypeptidase S1 [Arthroderma uncinatum]KAF3482837.1 carboxypeptidase S1 [Arthroderma uncinatum]